MASYIAIKRKQTRKIKILKCKKEVGIDCIYKDKETSQTSYKWVDKSDLETSTYGKLTNLASRAVRL